MHRVIARLRPTLRSLARSRNYTATAVLTLALGMGATTAIFTLVQRVVLDPLPYPQADRLVRLKNPFPAVGAHVEWELSTAQYFYYAQHAPDLSAIGLYEHAGANLTVGHSAQRVSQAVVTASMFGLLGGRAVAGRLIDTRDDAPGAPAVAVLSHEFWQREFGGDRVVVGRTVSVNDQPVQIVGVMAPGIELPADPGQAVGASSDLWMAEQLNPAGPFYNSHVYPAIGRLADGVTAAQAQAQIRQLEPELVRAFPTVYHASFFDAQRGMHTAVYPLKAYVLGDMARYLWIVFAGVGFVFVIACANVVNLFLVRLEARRREFAIRAALGAGWRHVAAEALGEGLMIALAAAALGLCIAYGGARWLEWLRPPSLPRLANVGMDWRAWAFSAGLALIIAALMAVMPVVQTRAPSALNSLGDGGRAGTAGRARQRLRGGLVVSQVALALVLAVSSTLLLRSFAALRAVNPGVDAAGVLTLQVYLPPQRYDSAYKTWQFIARTQQAIGALPGVTGVGAATELPFISDYGCTGQAFEDGAVYARLKESKQSTCAGQGIASPGYFEALGIPVLAGRTFEPADMDDPTRGAVVVSKEYATRFFGTENPIGKGLGPNGRSKPPFYRVIGVVGDVHSQSVQTPAANAVYYPIVPIQNSVTWYDRGYYLVVHTSRGEPMSYLPAVRAAVASADPDIPVADAQAMSTIIDGTMSRLTFTMMLLGIAGITAMLLAAVGLYGVVSYVVARRTNEIGVRLALGAQPRQVRQMVVRGALRLAVGGLILGTLGAAAFTRLLGNLLYDVAPFDAGTYAAAALLLAAVAALAGWIPARRAAAVDPVVALRAE